MTTGGLLGISAAVKMCSFGNFDNDVFKSGILLKSRGFIPINLGLEGEFSSWLCLRLSPSTFFGTLFGSAGFLTEVGSFSIKTGLRFIFPIKNSPALLLLLNLTGVFVSLDSSSNCIFFELSSSSDNVLNCFNSSKTRSSPSIYTVYSSGIDPFAFNQRSANWLVFSTTVISINFSSIAWLTNVNVLSTI